MPFIVEEQRVATLRAWGISDPLIRLSSGELVPELLSEFGLGSADAVYHGSVAAPDGSPLAVLWTWFALVLGVWRRGGGLEFIRYGCSWPGQPEVLARTEQGFWAAQFDFLHDCEVPPEELPEVAAMVGYRFLDRHLAAKAAAVPRLSTIEGHRAWLQEFVAVIDREDQDAEQVAAADRPRE